MASGRGGARAGGDAVWLDPAELLSGSQVAVILHVDKQKALDWIADGTIPSVTIGSNRRVPRWALIEWQRDRLGGAA